MTEPKKHKETAVDSSAVQPSRRNFLKFGASGIAAATLSTWIPSDGMLQAAPLAPAAPVVEDSDASAAGEQVPLCVSSWLEERT
ncbi:twin-arginine translocation signal domain-containing protein, partial [Pseudomonas syringae]|uniref:twin-arginine translocation signal domain-containing protein n=1 Tax=Pseudomonas syringae TaxID=317 RepID=UPI001141A835